MATDLYLVRHAHSVYTADEEGRPLSAGGIEDARTVTGLLKDKDIHCVISSPYLRAIQTVQGIADYIHQDIQIEKDFRERRLAGGPVEDFKLSIVKVWEDEQFAWEGGESNKAAQARGVSATLRVLERFEGNNVVIGTHGNIMVLIMNHFDRQYGFDFWKELSMPDIYMLSFRGNRLKDMERIWREK